ncbi:MAG: hypothetical protein AAF446_09395, partial [Pseudomonadota bacterium]
HKILRKFPAYTDRAHGHICTSCLNYRTVHSIFAIFYEIQDRYVVFIQSYNPGSDVEGRIGAPETGWRFATVYDKKNLNFLGRIAF